MIPFHYLIIIEKSYTPCSEAIYLKNQIEKQIWTTLMNSKSNSIDQSLHLKPSSTTLLLPTLLQVQYCYCYCYFDLFHALPMHSWTCLSVNKSSPKTLENFVQIEIIWIEKLRTYSCISAAETANKSLRSSVESEEREYMDVEFMAHWFQFLIIHFQELSIWI